MLTVSQKEQICEKYSKGVSLLKLNKEYKTTSQTVKCILELNGIAVRNRNIEYSEKLLHDLKKEYYETDISFCKLSQKYGIHTDSLIYKFKKMGWSFKPSPYRRNVPCFFSEESQHKIIELYNNGFSTREIAPLVGAKNSAVLRFLHKKGIYLRTKSESIRQYELDENYFEEINTPEKAYFLGFIYAEGHSEKNGKNTLTIGLQYKDKYILDFYKNELKSTRPLEFRKKKKEIWQDISVLRVGSLKLTNDLEKLGIPRGEKHHILEFPDENILKKDLIKYFILGYLDGDGCISKDLSVQISFASNSVNFLKVMAYKILEICKIKSRLDIKKKCANLEIGRIQDCIKLLNWLYEKPPRIFLSRKYQRFVVLVSSRLDSYKSNIYKKRFPDYHELLLKSKEIINANDK